MADKSGEKEKLIRSRDLTHFVRGHQLFVRIFPPCDPATTFALPANHSQNSLRPDVCT